MSGAVFKQHANIRLSSKVQAKLAKFREGSKSYGAFYVTSNGRGWGYQAASVNSQDADMMAKTGCEASNGRKCVLFATLSPTNTAAPNALPARFREDLEAPLRDNRGEFALAVAPIGPAGWSWNYEFGKDAKTRALEECRTRADKRKQDTQPIAVRNAFAKSGAFTCRIHLSF
ncbi:MAG: hypothetical protein AAF601_06845 [Pseudomonadota bacterium]